MNKLPSLLCLLLGLLAACHSKDTDKNLPNPCAGIKPDKLDFQFLEYTGTPTPDTAYNDQPITFVGPGKPYTSYEWLVGTLNARTTQKFVLKFDANTVGNIPVRLIAHRPPNTACFPRDTGVDTLTKTLTLVPFLDQFRLVRDPRAPIFGKFQGATRSAPRDTFTVQIAQGTNWFYPTDPTAPPTTYLRNVPKGCTRPYVDAGLSWRGVYANALGCTNYDASGFIIGHDSIQLQYTREIRGTATTVDEVFLGKRIR